MTDDAYLTATGQLQPVPAAYSVTGSADGDIDEADVIALVQAYGGDDAAGALPLRFGPMDGQPHPGDKVLIRPSQTTDGRYLALSFTMGYEDPDEMISWKPQWLGIDGPFTMAELEAFARDRARA
jgi:hypothetical protein